MQQAVDHVVRTVLDPMTDRYAQPQQQAFAGIDFILLGVSAHVHLGHTKKLEVMFNDDGTIEVLVTKRQLL